MNSNVILMKSDIFILSTQERVFMSRHKKSILQLSKETGASQEEILFFLKEGGIRVLSNNSIPKSQIARMYKELGLKTPPKGSNIHYISVIAENRGINLIEFKKHLYSISIINNLKTDKVPRRKRPIIEAEANKFEKAIREEERKAQEQLDRKSRKGKHKKRLVRKDSWPTIGPSQTMTYISTSDVEAIHYVMVDDFKYSKDPIDPPGVRSHNLLASAVFRPKTSHGQTMKYPSVAMAGAAILHAIIHDHPFHNGNKRTAMVSFLVLLDKNDWVFSLDQDAIYDFLLNLSAHQLYYKKSKKLIEGADPEMIHVAHWVQQNMRRLRRGDYLLQFRQLKDILRTYDCEFETPRSGGSNMKITRGTLATNVWFGGDGRDVETRTITKIRKDLELDEENGYDSDIFYNKGPRIPDFVNKYRKLLVKLAKT